MPPAILHDVLRLLLGASGRTPRGIDRVDLGYARYLFKTWRGDCFGVLPTPWGTRLYERTRVLRGLDALERLWREDADAAADPAMAQVRRRLAGSNNTAVLASLEPRAVKTGGLGGLRAMFGDTGLHAGRRAVAHAPRGSIYLNIGQLGWAAPWSTQWLGRRGDIKPVFLLHDTIPIERRDLVSRSGHWTHRMMLRTAARHAAGLIVTTDSAGQSVLSALRARGHPTVPTARLPLPVAAVFLSGAAADAELATRSYFLVCGAIEPRKNLLMLLQVWQTLVAQLGPLAPKLVIAGSLAHGGRPILQRIAACTAVRDHVIVVAHLSSPALRQLMAHAKALLMPSLAEGFGLPIIEALTLGTPVLASALPAHQEVGGTLAVYLTPHDEAAWGAEIIRLVEDGAYLAHLRARCADYHPLTAAQYFAGAANFLEGLG